MILRPHGGVMPSVDPGAFVAETAVLIGRVTVEAGASIWYGCVLRGDVSSIHIGRDTNIQDGTVIHCRSARGPEAPDQPCRIGARVTVGHMALLHACTVADDAFIGMQATVMDYGVVESGAMVAAGALVTPGKRVKSGELWAGSPAKMLRQLSEDEIAGFKAQAEHYCALARSYMPPAS